MALEFYVEQADRSPQSGVANEDIYAGELVHDDGDGVDAYVFADGVENVALARYDAQAMAAEWEEDIVEEKYVASDETRNRVQYQPLEDSAILRIRTPEDNGTDPNVSIGHRNVVGVVDASALQGSAAEYQSRIVEEGYDDGTTTFNRSNGNFKAIGRAYRPAQQAGENMTRYNHPVRVITFSELKE